jgi:hypothetical protein
LNSELTHCSRLRVNFNFNLGSSRLLKILGYAHLRRNQIHSLNGLRRPQARLDEFGQRKGRILVDLQRSEDSTNLLEGDTCNILMLRICASRLQVSEFHLLARIFTYLYMATKTGFFSLVFEFYILISDSIVRLVNMSRIVRLVNNILQRHNDTSHKFNSMTIILRSSPQDPSPAFPNVFLSELLRCSSSMSVFKVNLFVTKWAH